MNGWEIFNIIYWSGFIITLIVGVIPTKGVNDWLHSLQTLAALLFVCLIWPIFWFFTVPDLVVRAVRGVRTRWARGEIQ
jgi:hypothetical protein